jgi:hypothetical protein
MGKLAILDDVIQSIYKHPDIFHILYGEPSCFTYKDERKKKWDIDMVFFALSVSQERFPKFLSCVKPTTSLIIPYLPYNEPRQIIAAIYALNSNWDFLSTFAGRQNENLDSCPPGHDTELPEPRLVFWSIRTAFIEGTKAGKEIIKNSTYNQFYRLQRDLFGQENREYFKSLEAKVLEDIAPFFRQSK